MSVFQMFEEFINSNSLFLYYIFNLKIYNFNLKIYNFNLKIYNFNLKIYNFNFENYFIIQMSVLLRQRLF